MFSRFFKYSCCALALSVSPVGADSLSGAYLSAQQAIQSGDYVAAARYFGRALQDDPTNSYLLRNAMSAELGRGEVPRAIGLAKRTSLSGQFSPLVVLADHFQEGNFGAALDVLANEDVMLNPLLTGLLQGWAEFGRGDMTSAQKQFDALTEPEAFALYGQYHKAMALALAGDFESSEEILKGDKDGPLVLDRGSIIARAQVLSQLDRNEEARTLLADAMGQSKDPEFLQIIASLKDEPIPFDFITSPQEGAAEVLHTIATALRGEENDRFALVYSRLAEYLSPKNVGVTLLSADLLIDQGQYDLANASYAKVEKEHPLFLDAELGRAESLLAAEKPDAAIEVLRSLGKSFSENARIQANLGDALRGQKKYAEATEAYNRALELTPNPTRRDWFVLYARAITFERQDMWDKAEADFRAALELNPGQPLVLNYLGYSLVEKGLKIDEAQKMIEDAVAARPDDGYITDSLGWVLYTQGKFEEAIEPMERAVELVSNDPIINDHLGDVYWMVGRKREAQFQWRRALSFDPEEKDAVRIRAKLDQGLTVVLEQEEALKSAQGDGN